MVRTKYTLEQICDILEMEVPVLRQRDVKLQPGTKTVWRAYVAWQEGKSQPVYLKCKAKNQTEAFEILQPKYIAYIQGRVPSMIRFNGWAYKWVETVQCLRSTKQNYLSLLKKHIIPGLGERRLKDITVSDIREFLLNMMEKRSPKYCNECLQVLRMIFKAAIDEDLIQKNPALKVKKIKVPKYKVEAFTDEEVKKILTVAQELFPQYYAPIWMAFHTGLRAGELWSLQWNDIDGDRIHIRRSIRSGKEGHTKTLQERHVFIPRSLPFDSKYQSKLKGRYIFSYESGKFIDHRSFMRWVWKSLLEKANVNYRNFHCCRHTFASLHLRHGTSLEWISKQLGHASVEFTFRTYCHFLPKGDDVAAERLANLLAGESRAS